MKNGDNLVILRFLAPVGKTFSMQHSITLVAFKHAKIGRLTCVEFSTAVCRSYHGYAYVTMLKW